MVRLVALKLCYFISKLLIYMNFFLKLLQFEQRIEAICEGSPHVVFTNCVFANLKGLKFMSVYSLVCCLVTYLSISFILF